MSVERWDIDSLSGVYWLIGAFIAYCTCALAIGFGQRFYQHHLFKKYKNARTAYYLSQQKDKESDENHN